MSNNKPLCKNCKYWRGSSVGDKRRCLSPLTGGQTYVGMPGYSSALDGCSRYEKQIKKGGTNRVQRYL